MLRSLLLIVGLALLAGWLGCKTRPPPDPAAEARCKQQAKDAASCRTCCLEAGASGHLFVGGSGCRCL